MDKTMTTKQSPVSAEEALKIARKALEDVLRYNRPGDYLPGCAEAVRVIDSVSATAASGVKGADWIPIETAPKNGSRIELFFPEIGYSPARIECGHWELDKYAKKPRPYWTGDCERVFGVLSYRERPPTHYRLLPPHPIAAQPVQDHTAAPKRKRKLDPDVMTDAEEFADKLAGM